MSFRKRFNFIYHNKLIDLNRTSLHISKSSFFLRLGIDFFTLAMKPSGLFVAEKLDVKPNFDFTPMSDACESFENR